MKQFGSSVIKRDEFNTSAKIKNRFHSCSAHALMRLTGVESFFIVYPYTQ